MTDHAKPNSRLHGILNQRQLERFCERFRVKSGDLEANFRGWYKRVVLTRDRVYLFPRDHAAARDMKAELDLYAFFTRNRMPGLPRLLARVHDPDISPYEFGVIRRMHGVELASVLTRLSPARLERALVNLARLVATWHRVPLGRIPAGVPRAARKGARLTVENWGEQALRRPRNGAAVEFMYRTVLAWARKCKVNDAGLRGPETLRTWRRVLGELARMRPVLIMTDIHDEQVLLRSRRDMRIAGVFDWGGTRIDHPAWDFNFGEWNFTIFKYAARFAELREAMWAAYLLRRGLRLATPHGLHLFHTLNEFTWLIQRRKERRIGITRRSFRESVKLYCRRLEAATP